MTEPGTERVECYSGHTYPQEPRAVVWEGHRFQVTHVERRWRTPEGPAFRVETEERIPFELRYVELEDVWAIQPLVEFDPERPEQTNRADGRGEGERHDPHCNHHEDKEVREQR